MIPTLPRPFRVTLSQMIGVRGAEWECTTLEQPNSNQFIKLSFRLEEPTYPRFFCCSSYQFFRALPTRNEENPAISGHQHYVWINRNGGKEQQPLHHMDNLEES